MSQNENTASACTPYIRELSASGETVCVIITNGFQCKGRIARVYEDSILLDTQEGEQLVMRAAISTIKRLPKARK